MSQKGSSEEVEDAATSNKLENGTSSSDLAKKPKPNDDEAQQPQPVLPQPVPTSNENEASRKRSSEEVEDAATSSKLENGTGSDLDKKPKADDAEAKKPKPNDDEARQPQPVPTPNEDETSRKRGSEELEDAATSSELENGTSSDPAKKPKADDDEAQPQPVPTPNEDETSRKRSSEEDEAQQPQPTPNEDEDEIQPQLELMPLIPGTPPEAPSPPGEAAAQAEEEKAPLRVYTTEDTELWPGVARGVFDARVAVTNREDASRCIRGWFAEHEGLRCPPPEPPRSAYGVYFNEKKTLHQQQNDGKWDKKKDGKLIAAAWNDLGVDDQHAYHTKYDAMGFRFGVNNDFWHARAEEWGCEKARRCANNGEETPEDLARKHGGVSADDFYLYKWW